MTELAPDELISAIGRNVERVFQLIGDCYPGAEVIDTAEVLRYSTELRHPFGNTVVRTQLGQAEAYEMVQRILTDYKQKNVPVMWFVGPSSQPSNLSEILESAGGISAGNTPGMAADLTHTATEFDLPNGVRIQEVEGPAMLEEWKGILCDVFRLPTEVGELFSIVDSRFRPFTAYLDDKPVATSALLVADGIAGVYCVGTIPEARRKGIGAAVTQITLLEARKQGCRYAILQASEPGIGVYKQLGFVELCAFQRYLFNMS